VSILRGVSAGKVTQPRVVIAPSGQYTIYVTVGYKAPQLLYATSVGAAAQATSKASTLSLAPATFGITTQNGTVQLQATVKDQFGTIVSPTPALTWTTSDPRVTVSGTGLCTGVGTGAAATITATVTGTTVSGTATVTTPAAVPTTLAINAGFSTLAQAAAAAGTRFGVSINDSYESHPNYSQNYAQTAGAGGIVAFEKWHSHWFSGSFTNTGLSGVTTNFLEFAPEMARLQAQGTAFGVTYIVDEGIDSSGSLYPGIASLVTNATQAETMLQTMVALTTGFFNPQPLGPAWNSATNYTVGQVVSSGGVNYACVTPNVNTPPAGNISAWMPIPVATITAWSSTTAYTPGQIVTNGGHTYTCFAANTNQAPPNAQFWLCTESGVVDTYTPINECLLGGSGQGFFNRFLGPSPNNWVPRALKYTYAGDPGARKYTINNGHGESTADSAQRAAVLSLANAAIAVFAGIGLSASKLTVGIEGHVDCQEMQTSGGSFDTTNTLAWLNSIVATGASYAITEFDVTDHMLEGSGAAGVAQRQQLVGLAYTNFLNVVKQANAKPDHFTCWQLRSPENWLQSFTPRSDGLPMFPNPYADFSFTTLPAYTAIVTWLTGQSGLQGSITLNDALPHQIPVTLADQWGGAMSPSVATWSSTDTTNLPVTSGGVVQASAGGHSATITATVASVTPNLTASVSVSSAAAALAAIAVSPGNATISTGTIIESASETDQYGNPFGGSGNGNVTVYAAGGFGLSANIPGVAAATTLLWTKGRILVDAIRAAGLNSGVGLQAIDSDGAGTNKKWEVYFQTGSTAFVQLVCAPYKTGSVRMGPAPTAFINETALPANGNYIEWFAGYDQAAGHCIVAFFDSAGNLFNDGSHTSTATVAITGAAALNTDGGANGRVTTNKGFNAHAVAQAATHDGQALYTSALPAQSSQWTKPLASDSGIQAGWYMGDASSGAVTSGAAFAGGQALVQTSATGGVGDAGAWSPPSGATSVNWASDTPSVATVSPATGTATTVTPVAPGTANITATAPTNRAISGTAVITVQATPVPTQLTIAPTAVTLAGTGTTVQLVPTVDDQFDNPMTGVTVTYASSNTAVATVSAGGLVTWAGVGSATITATVASVTPNLTATCAVTATAAPTSIEPSGMTVILNTGVLTAVPANGQTMTGGSVFQLVSPPNGSFTTTGDANQLVPVPPSQGTGLRVLYPASLPGGFAPVIFGFTLPGAGKTLYIRMRVRYSPNWTNNGNVGTKICEPQFVNSNNGGNENDAIGGHCDNPPQADQYLQVLQQWGNGLPLAFRNLPDGNPTSWARADPNGQLAGPTAGTWHTIELLFTPQSSTSTADGGCRIMNDGNECVNATNVQWVQGSDSQNWGYIRFEPTYGGGHNSPPNVTPFLYWDFDELYVSSK